MSAIILVHTVCCTLNIGLLALRGHECLAKCVAGSFARSVQCLAGLRAPGAPHPILYHTLNLSGAEAVALAGDLAAVVDDTGRPVSVRQCAKSAHCLHPALHCNIHRHNAAPCDRKRPTTDLPSHPHPTQPPAVTLLASEALPGAVSIAASPGGLTVAVLRHNAQGLATTPVSFSTSG